MSLLPSDDIEITMTLEEELNATLSLDFSSDIRTCRKIIKFHMHHSYSVTKQVDRFVKIRLGQVAESLLRLCIVKKHLCVTKHDKVIIIMRHILDC